MAKKMIIGGLAALLVGGAVCLKRTPIEISDVGFGGYTYTDRPNVTLAFYDEQGNRFALNKRDNNFNHEESYDGKGPRIQGKYDVSGYKNAFGKYATSIRPCTE